MRVQKQRLLIASATAGIVAVAVAVAPAAQASTPATVSPGLASAKAVAKNVIVLLKNQHTTLTPKVVSGRTSARARAFASDQSPVVATAHSLGATHVKQFSVLNAFAATISSTKVASLSRDPDVAAIVPDLPISRPATTTTDAGTGSSASAQPSDLSNSSYCSTDQSAPILEPEALQTMHVAYTDPSTASERTIDGGAITGTGIKVGFIADGLDINNADFTRNGQSIFSDYQDFSGDGLAAQTSGAEAFGDASSIAAQGNTVYNLANYASAANPLPNGCYIRVQGVAPGASLVGLKVFGNEDSAPTSHFISAIQYAVTTAQVDVLNESFGGDPYPDTMDDPISLANNAAIDAGITVVASAGDAGTNGTIGSPATSPRVIGVAATTNFRSAAQIKYDGFSNPALGITGWANDNISSLSSGGYSSTGKVPDVSAPGDSAWAVCTANLTLYTGCADVNGNASPVIDFGGTSQSSPLTAGTAALVIQAYEQAHGGVRPSPAVVKSIIVGSAQDLGHPAYEQGSGEVDAQAAVQAALSIPAAGSSTVPSTATGKSLVTSVAGNGVDQLDLAGKSGSTLSGSYTVQNASNITQKVALSTRALTTKLSTQDGNITLDPSQTFPNVTGGARAYKIIDVKVPAGADRLDASFAANSTVGQNAYTVFMALVDPFGVFQAYSSPQGIANFGHVDARYPAPGVWKAMIWANPAFTNNINYEFTTSKYAPIGSVSPASLTLAPGASAKVTATVPAGTNAGDSSAAVIMKTPLGTVSNMPVSIRTLLPNSTTGTNTFTGVITGGNGRGDSAGPAQSLSYYVDVPSGSKTLNVSLVLNRLQYSNELIYGLLVGPDGQTQSVRSNAIIAGQSLDVGRQLFASTLAPAAGRWKFIVMVPNPTGGDVVNQPFTGTVSFAAAPISVSGLPTASTVLHAGTTYNYTVKVTNNSPEQQLYFADPRLDSTATYQLASQTPGNDLQNLSLPTPEATPQWLVPTGTSALNFYANATVPVGLDTIWQLGDPETFGSPVGNSASVTVSAAQVANGTWSADVGEPGPFTGAAPSGKVAVNLLATTKAFDTAADSSLGDYWLTTFTPAPAPAPATTGTAKIGGRSRVLAALRAQAATSKVSSARPAATPKATASCDDNGPILEAGASCTFTFAITPKTVGTTVSGHLHVQSLDAFTGTASDLASLPYAYTVKGATKATLTLTPAQVKHGSKTEAAITVTSTAGTPTGTVRLVRTTGPNAPSVVRTGTLVNGKVTLAYAPGGAGTFSIRAEYLGTASYLPANSPAVTLKVT